MLGNLSKAIYWNKILGNTAAGQDGSEVDESAIDARGYDRALFVLELGAVTETGKLALQIQESEDGSTGWADISGAGFSATVATGKSDDAVLVDVPVTEGYLRCQYQRTVANIEIDALQVILYNNKKVPVDQNSDVWKDIVV